MIAQDMISNLLPPLKTSDTGEKGLLWMHEFGVNHLPIVNNLQYLGLITEDDILDMSDLQLPIGNYDLSLQKPFVNQEVHVYEAIRMAIELKLTLVPVVDKEGNYVGVITQENIIKFFGTISSINEAGGIIQLELNKKEYALSEIGRIVESNNAVVLSAYVSTHTDSNLLNVTLKVNVSDIRPIVAAFERYEYTVKAFFQETEYFDELKDNFDSLMNYLNI